MRNTPSNTKFYNEIILILHTAKQEVLQVAHKKMVLAYFEVGKRIVEKEQKGEDRAKYGKKLLKGLSLVLTKEFGKGYSVTNIQQMRNFYLAYRKQQTLSVKSTSSLKPSPSLRFMLSWSHYLTLIRMDNIAERQFYEIEATKNKWSVRELQRQYDSALYTRLTLSRDKDKVKELSEKGLIIEKPKDAIKDPYILEFLGLPEYNSYSESEIEQELIDKLEHFLLELEEREAYEESLKHYRDIKNIVDTSREEGRMEGIEQGIEQGEKKQIIKTVLNFYELKLSNDKIAQGTGISIVEVEKILKEYKK